MVFVKELIENQQILNISQPYSLKYRDLDQKQQLKSKDLDKKKCLDPT